MKDNKKSTFVLQLTAMVDMFTIMIVFLLKSFSTSAVNITPQQGLLLPVSTAQTDPIEALKLVVAKDGVYVDDKKVVVISNGSFEARELDANDPDFLKALYDELNQHAEKSRDIAEVNEEHKFSGDVLLQADQSLSYAVLRSVMYTSSLAGFANLKMATVGE